MFQMFLLPLLRVQVVLCLISSAVWHFPHLTRIDEGASGTFAFSFRSFDFRYDSHALPSSCFGDSETVTVGSWCEYLFFSLLIDEPLLSRIRIVKKYLACMVNVLWNSLASLRVQDSNRRERHAFIDDRGFLSCSMCSEFLFLLLCSSLIYFLVGERSLLGSPKAPLRSQVSASTDRNPRFSFVNPL